MNCKRIQELIITDYIDARMIGDQKGLVDQHLAQCPICEGYLHSVKREAIGPFINVSQVVPEEFLWTRITKTIEGEQLQQVEKDFIPVFWEKLKASVHIPRPAFALVSIVTMVLMIGPTGQLFMNSQVVKINGQDQMEYLSSLIDEPVDVDNAPQTSIEKYFL